VDELRAGLSFVRHSATLRTLIFLAGTASLFGMAFITLLPAWAVTVLGGDSTTNGLLQSARGVGAVTATLFIASRGRDMKGRLLTTGSLVYPTLLLAYSFATRLPLSLLALVGAGWGMITMLNCNNAFVQTLVPDELRGRVASIYTLTLFGLMPLGALLAGNLADLAGEPNTVRLTALVALCAAVLVFWRVPRLRTLP
jgi:hypothetical protein